MWVVTVPPTRDWPSPNCQVTGLTGTPTGKWKTRVVGVPVVGKPGRTLIDWAKATTERRRAQRYRMVRSSEGDVKKERGTVIRGDDSQDRRVGAAAFQAKAGPRATLEIGIQDPAQGALHRAGGRRLAR